jgi:type III restriction enzyme
MPEQKHYDENPDLNYGYVYSASDNFEIVQELANNYISELQMERDEELNTKPVKLRSEFIRRKRELTRLSGEFKKCLFEATEETGLKDEININIKQISKTVALEGVVTGIDKEQQEVEFERKKSIKKDIKEVADSYVNFCAKMSAPYAKSRSTNIIKSAIRSWFKQEFDIGDEDKISLISMFRSNTPKLRNALEIAKDKYANLPTREDEVVVNEAWEVPLTISIFTDYEKIENSTKSIIKETEEQRLFVKKNKNEKIELSKPEISFINELDNTDDDILWWYKNGVRESRFFGIAYKKKNGFYYGFYPDFLIKTKKETLIVEIKDDKDFKPENALKLQAGRDYVAKNGQKEKVKFYMLSPMDYTNFFSALKDQELDKFKSLYEERLLRYNQSQKKLIESKEEQSKKDIENLDWLLDFDKTIDELEDQKLKNELLQMELNQAKQNISTLSETISKSSKSKSQQDKSIQIKTPFNICVLGEVSDTALIRKELNNYFEKVGVGTKDWKVEFFNNTKLQNSNVLRSLQKGQSKFDLIVTGQIYHHSGKGNAKANIISELKNDKYIPHLIGSNPKDMLTPDKIVTVVDDFLNSLN